jgi:hypothetical protein
MLALSLHRTGLRSSLINMLIIQTSTFATDLIRQFSKLLEFLKGIQGIAHVLERAKRFRLGATLEGKPCSAHSLHVGRPGVEGHVFGQITIVNVGGCNVGAEPRWKGPSKVPLQGRNLIQYDLSHAHNQRMVVRPSQSLHTHQMKSNPPSDFSIHSRTP